MAPPIGFKHSVESKKKMSQALMGNKHTLGRKIPDIVKKKMSISAKGKNTWSKGRKLTIEHRKKLKDNWNGKSGEEDSSWKGDKVGYSGLHNWVRKKLGTPSYCAYCQTTTAKKFEWANISHSYKRDLGDWIRLCTKCHHGYDMGKIKLLF